MKLLKQPQPDRLSAAAYRHPTLPAHRGGNIKEPPLPLLPFPFLHYQPALSTPTCSPSLLFCTLRISSSSTSAPLAPPAPSALIYYTLRISSSFSCAYPLPYYYYLANSYLDYPARPAHPARPTTAAHYALRNSSSFQCALPLHSVPLL